MGVLFVFWMAVTKTAAWKTLTKLSCRVCFPSARIRFAGSAGEERTGPTFSPALFYAGERPERFEKAFAGDGRGRVCGGVCGEAVIHGVPELRLWGFF